MQSSSDVKQICEHGLQVVWRWQRKVWWWRRYANCSTLEVRCYILLSSLITSVSGLQQQ